MIKLDYFQISGQKLDNFLKTKIKLNFVITI